MVSVAGALVLAVAVFGPTTTHAAPVLHSLASPTSLAAQAAVGKNAPAFTAKGSDGKNYSLRSLAAKGPVFLYFIKSDCPVNADAVKYYNKLGSSYRGKATFLGVINGDASVYRTWQAQYKATYPVLLDPGKKIITGFGAQASPWVIEVGKGGKIAKVWEGYSVKDLNALNSSMAKAAKVKLVKLDTTGAPSTNRYG